MSSTLYSKVHEVGAFIGELMKLGCQSRITFRRAVLLTYMANSLINTIRLQPAEDARAAKDPRRTPHRSDRRPRSRARSREAGQPAAAPGFRFCTCRP